MVAKKKTAAKAKPVADVSEEPEKTEPVADVSVFVAKGKVLSFGRVQLMEGDEVAPGRLSTAQVAKHISNGILTNKR